ncbi:MAG TPA: hypothetical protein PKI03_06270 [Pseudomonadota bacterium]|nr:hypothetical protein [Pseudomonadota bacterium]
MSPRNRSVSLAPSSVLRLAAVVGLFAVAAQSDAQRRPSDDSHSAFQKRRAISIADPGSAALGSTFAAIALPPEINGGGEPPFRDLRLVRVGASAPAAGESGDIAYLVEEQRGAVAAAQFRGTLLDTRSEYHPFTDHNAWLVDFGRGAAYDRIDLDIPERDFARRFKFEVAEHKGGPYRLLQDDVGIFDKIWVRESPHRIHHTHLTLDRVIRSRFLRITSDPVRFPPRVTVVGVTASRSEAVPGTIWTRPAPAEALPGEPGKRGRGAPSFSRYRLQLPPGLPIEGLTIAADDPAFARLVRVIEERPSKSKEAQSTGGQTVLLGEGVLFRVVGTPRKNRPLAPDSEVGGESLTLPLTAHPENGVLYVEIDASQGPPLSSLRFTVSGVGARLLFPLLPGDREFVLYYAAPTVRPPLYDLEALRSQVTQLEVRKATLGAESANPAYRVVPPLSFVRTAGAPVDVTLFRLQRTLSLSNDGKPDIYAATLAAEDLAVLGPSYGDLRIVDPEEHQIPYVLERSGSEGRLSLAITEAPRPAADKPRSPASTVLVVSYAPTGSGLSLPYEGLELEVTDPFYTRSARLFAVPPSGTGAVQAQGGERLLWSGTLSRKPDEAESGDGSDGETAAAARKANGSQHWQRLPFSLPSDLPRAARLRIEIDNGDNAPLTVTRAVGLLTLPRLAAKLDGSTAYRLLLSAPSVEAPRYDIETLRRELFDYAAVRAGFGSLSANPQYRARAADFLQDPSSTSATAILWGVLILAMLSLVGLTLRLLRRPPENPA